MKLRTRLKVLALFIFIATILILIYPDLLDGKVSISLLDKNLELKGLWIIGGVLLGCWCLEFIMELVFLVLQWPSSFKKWRLAQKQQEAKKTCFNQLMSYLWLNPLAKEYGQINATTTELTDNDWAALQQVINIRQMLHSRNFRQVQALLSQLMKLERFWGILWYYQVDTLMQPSDATELSKFNAIKTSHDIELTSKDLAHLTPEILNHLANLLQQSNKLTVLERLLKKANWRDVTNEKEKIENQNRLRILESARQENDQYQDLKKLWHQVPNKLQYYPQLAKWWFDELCRIGSKEAEEFLIKALEHNFSGLLFKDYVAMALQQKDINNWKERALKWLKALDAGSNGTKAIKKPGFKLFFKDLLHQTSSTVKKPENQELAADAEIASEEMVTSLIDAERAERDEQDKFKLDKTGSRPLFRAKVAVFKVQDTIDERRFALLSGLGDLALHLKTVDEALDYYHKAQQLASSLPQYLAVNMQIINALVTKKELHAAIDLATKSLALTQQNLDGNCGNEALEA